MKQPVPGDSDHDVTMIRNKAALSKDALKISARCILFLHSSREYEWPYIDTNHPILQLSLKDILLSVVTLGQHYRKRKKQILTAYDQWKKIGDYEVWPFFSRADYHDELTNQPFLNGRQNAG